MSIYQLFINSLRFGSNLECHHRLSALITLSWPRLTFFCQNCQWPSDSPRIEVEHPMSHGCNAEGWLSHSKMFRFSQMAAGQPLWKFKIPLGMSFRPMASQSWLHRFSGSSPRNFPSVTPPVSKFQFGVKFQCKWSLGPEPSTRSEIGYTHPSNTNVCWNYND